MTSQFNFHGFTIKPRDWMPENKVIAASEHGQIVLTITDNTKDTMTTKDITIQRNHDGALILSCLVGGYLVTRRFYGYTKREAIASFKRGV